ncbi:hypothetical protein [Nocardia puris]|uniref:Uncharacterized protein n=1 Tax=Nocardia puris TaxID=208602 RepID=A0A366CW40_9NOCA|nr:hypothetical protein [Nocardia puris]RBO82051.1 hypothetical protein DFR74_1256 [Nocardia puris]
MHTNLTAREAVITAIESAGTDVATRDEYDIDGIVDAIYEATGGYDIDALDEGEFWGIIEDHDLALTGN